MKRYIVFGNDTYYPAGGIYDLKDQSFDTPAEALAYAKSIIDRFSWAHVVDRETMKEVKG